MKHVAIVDNNSYLFYDIKVEIIPVIGSEEKVDESTAFLDLQDDRSVCMKFLHKMFNVGNYLKTEIRGMIFFCNLTICLHVPIN